MWRWLEAGASKRCGRRSCVKQLLLLTNDFPIVAGAGHWPLSPLLLHPRVLSVFWVLCLAAGCEGLRW